VCNFLIGNNFASYGVTETFARLYHTEGILMAVFNTAASLSSFYREIKTFFFWTNTVWLPVAG